MSLCTVSIFTELPISFDTQVTKRLHFRSYTRVIPYKNTSWILTKLGMFVAPMVLITHTPHRF